MDKDELLRRWAPVGPVAEGAVPSYPAKGPGGQFVQVHRVVADTVESETLSPLIQRVRAHAPPDLVEVVDLESGTVVVTHILPGGVTLEGWLRESLSRLDADAVSTESDAGSQTGPGDEDYSAYFAIPQQAQPPAPPPPQELEDPRPSESAVEEDTYTAFFETPGSPARPVAPEKPKEPSVQGGSASRIPTPPPGQGKAPRETQPPAGHVKVPPAVDSSSGSRKSPGGGSSAPPRSADSITDMFRKPEAPPPRRQESSRPERWSESQRALPALALSLDEYVRRLGYAAGDLREAKRGPMGGFSGPTAPPPPDDDWETPQARAASAPGPEAGHTEPSRGRARDTLVLVSVLVFVVVLAVVVVVLISLRAG